MRTLGHKNIKNTLLYTQLVQADEKYIVNVSEKTGKAYFHRATNWENGNLWTKQPAVIVNQDSSRLHLERQALEQAQSNSMKSPCASTISDVAALSRFFGGGVEPGKGVRQRAEQKIWKMGRDLGFRSFIGYEVFNLLNDGRNRFINVVWKTGNEITVAFQVRRRRQSPDVVTILRTDANCITFSPKKNI